MRHALLVFLVVLLVSICTFQISALTVCTSSGNSQTYEWIAKVNIGSFSNPSGASKYSDFTAKTISLAKGVNTVVSLTPGFSGGAYNEYWRIWIDLNKDGDFSDAGEQVFAGNSSGVTSGSITIPTSALAGNTPLRVSMRYNGAPPSCGTFDSGEVEDYTVNITGGILPPVTNFTASPTVIAIGGSTIFTDTSTNNPTGWQWTFQGGTPATSTLQKPTVTYNQVGTFNVTLTASNAAGSNTATKTAYITVNAAPLPPVADFRADKTAVGTNENVTFYDESSNTPTSWLWNFSGGTPLTATVKNPVVTYSAPGVYDVKLTAQNSAGSNSKLKTAYITVTQIPSLYCSASGKSFSSEWIAGVKLGGFINTSGAAGYSNFTGKFIPVSAGSSYSITLTPGFKSSAYKEYWSIWIDFNNNHVFDSNEKVFNGNGTSVVNGTIAIPVALSTSTRMRVAMKYNAAATPCESFAYGEVEDYTIDITDPNQPVYKSITVQESYALIQQNAGNTNFVIIDVRTADEFKVGCIENAINLDYNSSTFQSDLNQLDKTKAYLIYCNTGVRSASALEIMKTLQFRTVYNMLGGFTGWKAQGLPYVIFRDVTVQEANTLIQNNAGNPDFVILDVRTPAEYTTEHIANAVNLDYYSTTFQADLNKLNKTRSYLIYCRTGGRSGLSFTIMKGLGFKKLLNMLGGITEWKAQGYPTVQ